MEKANIKNRKGQKVGVIVEQTPDQEGLAFVLHGLSGFKEQPHIETFAKTFRDKGFTVVRFDTTNTFGESDGNYEDATITTFYEDLEDVIAWAKFQPWYQEPFYLAGHSLGSICTLLYAENHPQEVKGLAPISTVISGKLSAEAHGKEYIEQWKKTGWKEEKSGSMPGLVKRLKWSHMVDRLKYDALPNAENLTMPVLLIVGEKDEGTPVKHQRILFNALPGKKEFHVIKGAPHTFKTSEQFKKIKHIFSTWIDSVEK